MKSFSLVILALQCSITFEQNYTIIRQAPVMNDNDNEYDQPDLVQIPSPLCHHNGTTECPLMDGTRYAVCQCTCGEKDASRRFYKSTFVFYDGRWKCEKNSALRRRSGCQLSLEKRNLNDSILTVQTTIVDSIIHYVISNITTTKHISIPDEVTCSLKADNSMYLTCSGEWKPLDTTLVTKRFHVHLHGSPDETADVQVIYTEDSSYPLPSGRIIKLAVTCSDRPWEPSQCILLKIEGQLQCPVSPILPTTLPAQPPVVHPTFVPSLTSQAPIAAKSSFWVIFVSPAIKPGGNVSAPKKGSSITFDTGLIIGISLSGVAVLAALIVLVCFIVRLRKRRFINNNRKASTIELVAENETYGETVVGAKKPPEQEQEDPEEQRRTTNELVRQEEPLYTIPGSTINENNSQQDEPFYQVLEEPQPSGAQTYDMHEGLQPDKEPHVYGTFNEPHQTAPSDDTPGYSNAVYDSVGDISKRSK